MLRQLYLPYSNFRLSVACYSDPILLETLKTIHNSRAYVQQQTTHNMPENAYYIWQEWHRHYQAFARLAVFCYEEGLERGLPVSHTRMDTAKSEVGGDWTKPHWVGWETRHARHRANLLNIGAGENLARRICTWKFWEPDVRSDRVCRYIQRYFRYDQWHTCKMEHINIMHNDLTDQRAPEHYGNHYWQFGWTEEPTHEYLAVPDSSEYMIC
jgi:hypothetical protein